MKDNITLLACDIESKEIEYLLDLVGSSLGDLITLTDMIQDHAEVQASCLAGAAMAQTNDIRRAVYAIRDEVKRRQEGGAQ